MGVGVEAVGPGAEGCGGEADDGGGVPGAPWLLLSSLQRMVEPGAGVAAPLDEPGAADGVWFHWMVEPELGAEELKIGGSQIGRAHV